MGLPDLASEVLRPGGGRPAPPAALTPRERDILAWVARGKSNSVIGDVLGISPHTVDTHLRRIYAKLGVSDRISAALAGVGIGLIHSMG